jgi:hypothetical protein
MPVDRSRASFWRIQPWLVVSLQMPLIVKVSSRVDLTMPPSAVSNAMLGRLIVAHGTCRRGRRPHWDPIIRTGQGKRAMQEKRVHAETKTDSLWSPSIISTHQRQESETTGHSYRRSSGDSTEPGHLQVIACGPWHTE